MTLLALIIWLCSAPSESLAQQAATAFRQSGRVCCSVILGGEPAIAELDTGAVSTSVRYRLNDSRFLSLKSRQALVMTLHGPAVFKEYEKFPVRIFGRSKLVPANQWGVLTATEWNTSLITATVGNFAFLDDVIRINTRHGILKSLSGVDDSTLPSQANVLPLHWSHGTPTVPINLPVFGDHEVALDTGSNAFVTLKPAFVERLLRARQAVYLKDSLLASPKGQKSVKMYCLRSLKLGGVEFQNVPVVPAQVESIGRGLLQHFEMILDFPGNQVTLSALDLDHTRFPVDASGLRVYFDNDRLLVHKVDADSPAASAGFLVDDQILEFAGRDPSTLWRHEIDETLARAGETIRIRIARGDVVQEIPLPLSRPYQYPPDWPPILPEFNPDPVRN